MWGREWTSRTLHEHNSVFNDLRKHTLVGEVEYYNTQPVAEPTGIYVFQTPSTCHCSSLPYRKYILNLHRPELKLINV